MEGPHVGGFSRGARRRLITLTASVGVTVLALPAWLGGTALNADAAAKPAARSLAAQLIARSARQPVATVAKAKPLASVYAVSKQLAPGGQGFVAIHVAHRSVCALTFRTGGGKAGPFPTTVNSRYATWSWKVPAKVRGGNWKASITCRRARKHRTMHATIAVAGAVGGKAAIASRRGMATSVTFGEPELSSGGPQAGGGKGGNPCLDASQPGSVLDAGGYCTGNCTHYAWTVRQDLVGLGNAYQWGSGARARNIPTGTEPVVGAVAWWDRKNPNNPNDLGHVAIVTAVSADGSSYTIHEMNHLGYNLEDDRPLARGAGNGPTGFIYGGPASGAEYIGHIVHWNADTKAQKTSWLVINDSGHPRRNWIPDSSTFYCLKGRGAPGPDELSADVLSNLLPDENGVRAKCGGGGGDPLPPPETPPPPTPTPAPTQAPPTPPQTWSEQESPNHPVSTFQNPHNASGVGSQIAAGQTVQVSCKVKDGTIQSVNPDGYWYRIASSPWNNAYYAAANTFMNGDPIGGPYSHNTDFAVPDC
jgi:surface antigen